MTFRGGDAFAAEHGSWNRERRTGYKVIRIRRATGCPLGEYEDFLTGFVVDQRSLSWGRPVGVAWPTTGRSCRDRRTERDGVAGRARVPGRAAR
jgi:glucose/arabinose dehydrogenase